ncbi:MAG: cytochrome c biogenesis protein CcdA, partial [Planctomycetota bacterium]|nr:cytochrome c biogenesis protein CcdA [Planctomycetota bacterium]
MLKRMKQNHVVLMRILMAASVLLWGSVVGTTAAQNTAGSFGSSETTVTGTAHFKLVKGSQTEGQLTVQVKVVEGFHIYSVTQKPGGPLPSVIRLGESKTAVTLGTPVPDQVAEIHAYEVYPGLDVEEHHGTVTWTVPIEFASAVQSPQDLKLAVQYSGLACTDDLGICKPASLKLSAAFAGVVKQDSNEDQDPAGIKSMDELIGGDASPDAGFAGPEFGEFGVEPGALVVARATYFVDKESGTGQISLRATVQEGYHIYSLTQKPGGPLPTTLAVSGAAGLKAKGTVRASKAPEIHQYDVYPDLDVEEIKGTIRWWIPFEVDMSEFESTPDLDVVVILSALACTDDLGQCVPQELRMEADASATLSEEFQAFMRTSAEPPLPIPAKDISHSKSDPAEGVAPPEDSLAVVLGFALLGGFILNFMPCVLPVIGLKIMSFAQQAGESRGRVFMLNVWYSSGLMTVFLVIASLAVGIGWHWGQQNQSDGFNIVMSAVIFVMALSFIGVWEIPIPGFVGTGKMAQKAEKEGPAAAYIKGIITTLLAIPCSGPGLGVALTYCAQQLAAKPGIQGLVNVYAVFVALGLGMAFPYIVIGAFPGLVKFLPKPGAWMETFKELMGYVLLATVVFIMTYISFGLVVPTIAFLFALWIACWWLGRIPFSASPGSKLGNRMASFLFAIAAGWFCFTALGDVMQARFEKQIEQQLVLAGSGSGMEIDEQGDNIYTASRLQELLDDGRYVMVDYTADWCLTCKTLEQAVLKTDRVQAELNRRKVIRLVADWTVLHSELGKQIELELERLQKGKQLPIIAFYFPDDRNNP